MLEQGITPVAFSILIAGQGYPNVFNTISVIELLGSGIDILEEVSSVAA